MNFCELGLAVIETEAQAIFKLTQCIDQNFTHACELLLNCKGRVVVTGMGKSGHIGSKIAATLASTGTPAFFMHPGEASHGDFGMITAQDVVIAISYSGFTHELLVLLPLLKRLQVPYIALTGNANSTLSTSATVSIDLGVHQEACPLGLAPTTSTTATLVMGDALAIALLQARGFSSQDFALSHPGGALGRKLLLRVDDLWHTGNSIPIVNEKQSVASALIEVTEKKLGMTCVVNDSGVLVGVYTDGDIRRTLTNNLNINTTSLEMVITRKCCTITSGLLAAEALALMQKNSITSLVVVDSANKPCAVIHIHDLLRANIY